ncbi:MAG: glycosyltransferase family 2 protein [Methylophaga sp.]|nr:glycosyltransferase family 2 protein [Methylophaga sp.]
MQIKGQLSISIVSHGQANLVCQLLEDMARHLDQNALLEIIVTLNKPESFEFPKTQLPIRTIFNDSPKGFAANHNQAFRQSKGEYFCVLNPDLRLIHDPFPELINVLEAGPVGAVAPFVTNSAGQLEDSLRKFPTMSSLLTKLLGLNRNHISIDGEVPEVVDWVGGMFMLFKRQTFEELGGFDEGFFLYYEDVDICTRLWKSGKAVVASPKVSVIHDAQRTSHKNLKYLKWHIASMLRYFAKHWMRLPKTFDVNSRE